MPDSAPYKCPVCERRRLAKIAYKRTPKGFLMRRYIKMRYRIKNDHKKKNFAILPIKQFYQWAMKDTTFIDLYLAWKDSGRLLALTPIVDRINHKRGYEIDNIQWLTFQENAIKAGREGLEGHEKWTKSQRKKKVKK